MCNVADTTEQQEDGVQAARWYLLGYGKAGCRPGSGSGTGTPSLNSAPHMLKGVPEQGAELLHTLLNSCIAGMEGPLGGAGPVVWGSKEEALVVASATVAVADLALEEDVAVLLASADMAPSSSSNSSSSSSSAASIGEFSAGWVGYV